MLKITNLIDWKALCRFRSFRMTKITKATVIAVQISGYISICRWCGCITRRLRFLPGLKIVVVGLGLENN